MIALRMVAPSIIVDGSNSAEDHSVWTRLFGTIWGIWNGREDFLPILVFKGRLRISASALWSWGILFCLSPVPSIQGHVSKFLPQWPYWPHFSSQVAGAGEGYVPLYHVFSIKPFASQMTLLASVSCLRILTSYFPALHSGTTQTKRTLATTNCIHPTRCITGK